MPAALHAAAIVLSRRKRLLPNTRPAGSRSPDATVIMLSTSGERNTRWLAPVFRPGQSPCGAPGKFHQALLIGVSETPIISMSCQRMWMISEDRWPVSRATWRTAASAVPMSVSTAYRVAISASDATRSLDLVGFLVMPWQGLAGMISSRTPKLKTALGAAQVEFAVYGAPILLMTFLMSDLDIDRAGWSHIDRACFSIKRLAVRQLLLRRCACSVRYRSASSPNVRTLR